MTAPDPPSLPCPACGAPLAPAEGRGRRCDGAEHRISCRCHWCDWRWYDDGTIYACPCGARARVCCDDEHAYLTEVTP